MIRRLFRWLADVPASVGSFGRRLDLLRDELYAEIDSLKNRDENRRGQLLTLQRQVSNLKGRTADVENWLEGVDSDELPDLTDLELDTSAADELAHRRLTPPREDKRAV